MLPKTWVLKFLTRIRNTTLTQAPSHWLWLESSHSVQNVIRVNLSHHFSQRDSSRLELPKIVTRVESLSWITLSLVQNSESFHTPTKKRISLDFPRYLHLPLSFPVFTFTFIFYKVKQYLYLYLIKTQFNNWNIKTTFEVVEKPVHIYRATVKILQSSLGV